MRGPDERITMNEFLNKEMRYYTAMEKVATGNIKAYFNKMIQITMQAIIQLAIHGE